MKTSPYILLMFLVSAATAFANVTVSTPSNGAEVSSSFHLSANAWTCSSQPVDAMGYSLDSSPNTTIVENRSIDAEVPAPMGRHTLHVKAWGNRGATCVTDVALKVTSTATAVRPAAVSGSSRGIMVSSPGNGSVVGTSFSLVAGATDCSSQPISAMGYSLDNSSDTTIVRSRSVASTLTTSAGAHTLHVKAWGNGGAACSANIAIKAQGSAPSVAGSNGIVVSSPANGAAVSSSFTLAARAWSCSSQPVSSMGYSLDGNSYTAIFNGTSLNASISAPGGAHTLHVKAWGNRGAVCSTNVAIHADGGGYSNATSVIPRNAVSVSSIQTLSNWNAIKDSGTGSGWASGSMWLSNPPALSTHARGFTTRYGNHGGERYNAWFGDDRSARNFFYDTWVYISDSANSIGNLEFDMNQTMPNGQTAIFGFQCDGYTSTWDYTKNAGSPTRPVDQWVHSHARCNMRNWSPNTWHHVQIHYSRDNSGYITYHSVWLDNVEQNINATVPSAFALGWAPALLTNFQVDGRGAGGSATVYLDKLTIYRW